MKNLLLVLALILPLSAVQLKTGLLYTGWPATDSTLNGMIEISTDSLAVADRLPVQMIYLVDISRESAGSVRQGLIEGGKELIKSLRDDDRFGIVLYSKFARTLLPLTNLTAETRKEAIDLLERISTEEGRDLSAALTRVASEFKLRAGERIEGRYLVMTSLAPITDGKKGRDLIDDLNIIAATDSMGCITHTVSYGESFNDEIAIRAAEQSDGRAYLAPKDRPDSLVGIFKQVGSAVTSPVCRDLELFIDVPEGGVKLCRFGTNDPLPNPLKVKQIARGKTERIMFTLKNRPEQSSVLDFDLDYYDVALKTRQNLRDNLKVNAIKEPIYNTAFAATLIRGSILENLAENIYVLRRVDKEMDSKAGKDFRRNYAFKFQQQVVNRLETVKSSVGTTEMDHTIKLMQQIFEEIRDGVYSNEYLIRRVQFDFNQTLHGR